MKVSDYIVEYLISQGVEHVFGYPGGMVTHLIDSLSKYDKQIAAHVMYHEQGAAFAACGYAQTSGKTGVAYATSGPGATNLITGICNAYMDSIPTLFITGQVNSFEQKGNLRLRQRGFQEADIVSMVTECTKYAARINDPKRIKYELQKAMYIANEGRKGPVLLDIAMDVTRSDVVPEEIEAFVKPIETSCDISMELLSELQREIGEAKMPVLIVGNGLERSSRNFGLINSVGIPVVTSMIAVDFKSSLERCYGFIGAYGDRVANFLVAKSDLIITIGARLDIRQVGANRERFAPAARIVRIDIDAEELAYKVHKNELAIVADAERALGQIAAIFASTKKNYARWIEVCEYIRNRLIGMDKGIPNTYVCEISKKMKANTIVTTDVGQNQVWVAQSFVSGFGQRVLFSGGDGAMGYSLPASIGAALASGSTVYSFNGDGGIQMNIQELQTIVREQLPVKIIVLNNNSLGMIRHFQEMYFDSNYFQTVPEGGFLTPDFTKIAKAYGVDTVSVRTLDELCNIDSLFENDKPCLIEVSLDNDTYVFPKLQFGKPNQDQEPLIDRNLYFELMEVTIDNIGSRCDNE